MNENPLLNIVLVEPEIPNNTGNIGRTCLGTLSRLHLVEPLGFDLSDRSLKRAGLDYWPHLDVQVYKSLSELFAEVPDKKRMFFFSTKVDQTYTDVAYQPGDWLFFGPETRGLDKALLEEFAPQCVTIPMPGPKVRSLNLSNSVAIALFEGFRQIRLSQQG